MAWIGVITNVGHDLLTAYASGEHTLHITRASVGSGTVAEADLRIQTEITTEKMDASIINIEPGHYGPAGGGYVKYSIQVGPSTVAVGAYTAHQIGLWATLDDEEEETLLMLSQDSGSGIDVPVDHLSPKFAFCLYAVMQVGGSESTTVNIDSSAYVDMLTLEQMLEGLDAKHIRAEVTLCDPEEEEVYHIGDWHTGTWTATAVGTTEDKQKTFTAPSGMKACAVCVDGVTKDSAIVEHYYKQGEDNVTSRLEYDTYDDGWIMISTKTYPTGEVTLVLDII